LSKFTTNYSSTDNYAAIKSIEVSTDLKNSLFFNAIVDLNFALLDLVREEILRALSPVGLALN